VNAPKPKAAPAPVKPSGNAITRQFAEAKKPAPKPAAAKPVAAAPAPAPAAAAAEPSLGVSLLQRMEAEAGFGVVSGTTSSVSDQLAALRRLDAVIKSTEERLELQERVDRLESEVRALKRHA